MNKNKTNVVQALYFLTKAALILILLSLPCAVIAANELNEPSWVYKGRGDRYLREGEIGKAIAQYKKAQVKRSRETENAGGISYPEVNLKLAVIYMDDELYDLALRQIAIVENKKEFLQIPDVLYDMLYTKAEIYLKMGKMNEMISVYDQIIESDVNWDPLSIEQLTDIPITFIAHFKENAELRKKFAKAYYTLGELKYLHHNYITAEPYLKMSLIYSYGNKTKEYLIDCYKKLGKGYEIERIHDLNDKGLL